MRTILKINNKKVPSFNYVHTRGKQRLLFRLRVYAAFAKNTQ